MRLTFNPIHTIIESGNKITFIEKNINQTFIGAKIRFGSRSDGVPWKASESEYLLPLGTAHFLEHMLFYKQGQHIGKNYLSLGAYCNAATSFDHTLIYATMNHNETTKQLLNLLADTVFLEPDFSQENVNKEKKIITAEIQKNYGDYFQELNKCFFEIAYHSHPLLNPITGFLDSIQNITIKNLLDAYTFGYFPSNIEFYCLGKKCKEFDSLGEILFKRIQYLTAGKVNSLQQFFPQQKTEPSTLLKQYGETELLLGTKNVIIGYKDPYQSEISHAKRDIYLKLIAHVFPEIFFPQHSHLNTLYSASQEGIDYGYVVNMFKLENKTSFEKILNQVDKSYTKIKEMKNKIFEELLSIQLKLGILFDSTDLFFLSFMKKDTKYNGLADYTYNISNFSFDEFLNYYKMNVIPTQFGYICPPEE